jgi:uncharacterized DUF497 family protein
VWIQFVRLEWDEAKLWANLAKHKLDFRDAQHVFDGRPLFTHSSRRGDEARQVSVGELEERMVAVVWLDRDCVRRIISMRRARRGEEREYRQLYDGRA